MIKLSGILLLTCFLTSSCASNSGTHELTKEEHVKLLMEAASGDLNDGDPTSALIALKQAEDLNPKAPEIQYMLALTYYQKNEMGLATRAAQKAVQLLPTFSGAKNTLGKLLLDQGKLVEAEKYLIDAAHDLSYREAYLAKTNLGVLYTKKLNPTEAERWFTKAIFDAGDAACMAYYYRGQIYFEKNLFDKANADFSRASKKLCAQFSEAHLAVGKTFLRLKKYDLARAKLLEVQQLFPSSDAAIKANDYLKDLP